MSKSIKPTCPECGAAELYYFEERVEKVCTAIDEVFDDYSISGWDMGPAKASEGHYEYTYECRDDPRVICQACDSEFEDIDVVYDQIREAP